jgi:hypothetical protein
VQGGIHVGGSWVVQPLTDFVWIGNSTDIDSQVRRLVLLLCSLRSGIEKLNDQFIAVKDGPEPGLALAFPCITSYPNHSTGETETIIYHERIHAGLDRETSALFSATSQNGTPLFIKFATRYNATAHRLLAENGYAPKLLYHSEVAYGGTHTMAVMDRLDGHNMHNHFSRKQTCSESGRRRICYIKMTTYSEISVPTTSSSRKMAPGSFW